MTSLIIIVCQAAVWPSAYGTWLIKEKAVMYATAATWIAYLCKKLCKKIWCITTYNTQVAFINYSTQSPSLCYVTFWNLFNMTDSLQFLKCKLSFLHFSTVFLDLNSKDIHCKRWDFYLILLLHPRRGECFQLSSLCGWSYFRGDKPRPPTSAYTPLGSEAQSAVSPVLKNDTCSKLRHGHQM